MSRACRLVGLALGMAAALLACQATGKSVTPTAAPPPLTASPVQSITGLPSGTGGYPWWNDTVFYEVFVRSFYDSNGDGSGDLPGLISKLDYLKDLGITGLWLMPIHPAASYHGYDVLNFYAVSPDYGGLDDMRRLLTAAHARGMRVVIDLVLNHTSDQHPWFQAGLDPRSSYHGWYVWSATAPDLSLWHPAPPPSSGYYYGYFGAGMPDLNYRNPAVTAQMDDVVRFWLRDVGVDGFRVDAAKHLIEEGAQIQNTEATHTWYRNFRSVYKALDPNAMTVGEIQDVSPTAASYAQGDQLDLAFDFSLAQSFLISARTGQAAEALGTLTADLQRSFKPLQLATFLTNHDQNRVRSQLAGSLDKARVAAAMLLTSPGVPFIYYGEEIGMLGLKPDERIRSPMQWSAETNAGFTTGIPWEAVNPDYADVNAASEEAEPDSLLQLYRELIRARNEHAALRVGSTLVPEAGNPSVFALLRSSSNETVLIVINLTGTPLSDYRLSLASGPLFGSYLLKQVMGYGEPAKLEANPQGGFNDYRPIPVLPAWGILILQLTRSS